MNDRRDTNPDANRDPITGAPGSHPVGVAAGGTAGAIAGAAVGSIFGPIGTLVGGGIGAVGGAAGGKALAERVDPTAEVEYWREGAASRDYYQADRDFDRDYAPAYRMGTEYRNEAGARDWSDVVGDRALHVFRRAEAEGAGIADVELDQRMSLRLEFAGAPGEFAADLVAHLGQAFPGGDVGRGHAGGSLEGDGRD